MIETERDLKIEAINNPINNPVKGQPE